MTDLLTHQEYQALAASLDFPQALFVDGRYRAGQGPSMVSTNPANGQQLAVLTTASDSDVDFAVDKARESFEQGSWSRRHPSERKETLIRLCKLIKRNRRELAVMESLDSGKPVSDCELIDLPEVIQTIKWHAEAIDKLYDQSAPVGDDAMAVVVREPVGVVAAVLPWNFPLLMLAWKIAPALAAGNSVLVKPAEQTSLTALRMAELASEAGIPRGVFQVLTGSGEQVGKAIGLHPGIDMVSFTGSTETGKQFLRYSADSNVKKVVLECGGKNPAVVFSDAENLDLVAEHVVVGAFWNMGQNCSAISRLIVHTSVRDDLLERIRARLRDWKTGDPLDPANHLGALVDQEHQRKVAGFLDGAVHSPIAGGRMNGCFLEPTIYDPVEPGSTLARKEIFGPVLAVIPVSSDDEAIAVANDTDYGLTAAVFSANARTAMRAARSIKAGTVTINCYGEGDITTPFGGYKQSGFGGRDNGLQAHDQYTELKTIWLDLSDPDSGDQVS